MRRVLLVLVSLSSWMVLAPNGNTAPRSTQIVTQSERAAYSKYFNSTLASLECLRSDDGLINDRGTLPRMISRTKCRGLQNEQITSPTNVGFDLLSQLEAMNHGPHRRRAQQTIGKILRAVSKLERHPDTGLYFSWYQTTQPFRVLNRNVSSVDNIHLALALWTVSEKFPATGIGKASRDIFQSMDFSCFYRLENGLIGGNLHYNTMAQLWTLESWSYSYYGSEARSIGALGFALRKFSDPDFVSRHVSTYQIEFTDEPLALRTWDGGVFQLLLPELLMSEHELSPILKSAFKNFSQSVLLSQNKKSMLAPPTHSASQAGLDGVTCGSKLSCYNGKAGELWMVASTNQDAHSQAMREQWEAVFTPHAAMLVASIAPGEFAAALSKLETFTDGDNPLYDPVIGWMDGLRVAEPYPNTVVPVQLALDQEILLLAASRILSADGKTESARALAHNSQTRQRLHIYYESLERRFAEVIAATKSENASFK